MEKSSEILIRSTLHDLANVLAGVRGILDLNQPGQPLAQRDRDRLDAVVEEGVATLDRCRHLALATLPRRAWRPGRPGGTRLLEDLEPMAILFRCRFSWCWRAPELGPLAGQAAAGATPGP